MLDFVTFNILEGLFWIMCGVVLLLFKNKVLTQKKSLPYFAALSLIFFGLTDFIEVYTNQSFFLEGYQWLLLLKAICLVCTVICLIIYIISRLGKTG